MLPFRLYAITDEQKYPGVLESILPEIVTLPGVAVQFREKQRSAKELATWIASLQKSLEPQYPFHGFVNDRADVAMNLDCAGVQLPESGCPLPMMHPLLKQHLMVGVSTHSIEGVLKAQADVADFVTLSPVFPTPSKPGLPALGVDYLREAVAKTSVPIFALGGVTPNNAIECMRAGAHGVAVMSSVWGAKDPMAVIRDFLRVTLMRVNHIGQEK